jgi:integrase
MEITIPHVTARNNRDGTKRYYFFRRGQPLTRLPGEPRSAEFEKVYDRCMNWVAPAAAAYEGSFEWLCDSYMKSPAFTGRAEATRKSRKRVIKSMMKELLDPDKPHKFGQERAKRIGVTHIEILRDRKAANPNAGNERLKVLAQVFKFAKVKPNPVKDVERLSVPQGGHETATDEDIAKYEAKHPAGPARLAMDILKHTGVRVSDLRLLGRQHVRNGLITFTTVKTKMLCRLPINALELPRDRMTFVLTEEGAAFASDKALSQRVAKWFRQAGVRGVTAHSVRKWRATKMAEGGATENQLMAWFGWKDAKEARVYTQAADRLRMADDAGKTAPIVQREPSNAV